MLCLPRLMLREVGVDAVDHRAGAAFVLGHADGLDLPDLGAEVGEDHDAVGAGEGPGEVEEFEPM